jgi:hypothetical protein
LNRLKDCSIFVLENFENFTCSQGKCRILSFSSPNNFYIQKKSRNQPGKSQRVRAGRRSSCWKLRAYEKKVKRTCPAMRCGVTIGKGHL